MSDSNKWEVVSGGKKKARIGNGVNQANLGKIITSTSFPLPTPVTTAQVEVRNTVPGAFGKSNKPKKHSRKTPTPFPGLDDENSESFKESSENEKKKDKSSSKPVQKQQSNNKGSEKQKNKQVDLETALRNVSTKELKDFFQELKSAGTVDGINEIKYTANALNAKLTNVIAPDVNQWPNSLYYPVVPKPLQDVIQSIITETCARGDDILDQAFCTLMASIPRFIQRGDNGWGYLLFLREMCALDGDLVFRRSKSFLELMESFGNRKEIGICVLWVASTACLHSQNMLKIVNELFVPYYTFRHYKNFVLAALSTISAESSSIMGGDGEGSIEAQDFDEFFEASFDVKRKKDFEKIYPQIKNSILKNLGDNTNSMFLTFLQKISAKDFNSASPYGREVLDVAFECLENDSSTIDTWRNFVGKFPRESTILVSYMCKVVGKITCQKFLENQFFRSEELAEAGAKFPDLLRLIKKLQTAIKMSEAAKGRYSWKFGCLIILLTIVGIIFLDVTENGKGHFENSHCGKFLKKYELLDEVMTGWNYVAYASKTTYDLSVKLFRNGYEAIRPMLSAIEEKVNEYIPELSKYMKNAGILLSEGSKFVVEFMRDHVFVGYLSPENLRRVTKESLSLVMTNVHYFGQKAYTSLEFYLKQYNLV